MTADELEIIVAKIGGGVLGIIVFWWVYKIIRGRSINK